MSDLNEDLSQSLAAELTGTTGMTEDGGNAPDDVLDAVAEQEQHAAERDIPVNSDLDDTRQDEATRAEDVEQSQQRGKKVPLAALHEERTKRQALEVQLQAQAQQLQQFMAQQQAAQQAQLQAQQEAAIPDFDEDPRGYIEAKEKQFAQQLEQLQNQQGQQPQHQQLEQQVMQEAAVLGPVVVDAEARFEAANPDYPQAAQHALAAVEANMRAQHPGINDQQLGMLKTAALVTLAKQCQAQGVNPAEYLYQRAQAMGFKPASRAPRVQPNTSLGTLSGSARAPDEHGSIGVSDISSMSEAEFDKFWSQMKGDSAIGPKF